jgi:FkbM family methyltransferase
MARTLHSTRSIVKHALAASAGWLPYSIRRPILDGLLDRFGRPNVLKYIGEQLHVEDLSIAGANGTIYGSLKDSGLLWRYATAGAWSSQLVGLFQQFFEQHGTGTYVDIGANIGLTLIPIARNSSVQCHGFEPEPRNFEYLSRNVAINCHHTNVTLHKLALLDRTGPVELATSTDNSGDHQIDLSNGHDAARQRVSILADRLDNVLRIQNLASPIAIKIDVQGVEPAIFEGGQEILAAAKLMSVEFWPSVMRRNGLSIELELSLLESHFTQGSITSGDSDEQPEWKPIGSIADRLRSVWSDPSVGMRYFDVLVRKD